MRCPLLYRPVPHSPNLILPRSPSCPSFSECVRQPFDAPLSAVDQHHVEAAGVAGPARGQVVPGRGDHAPPLGGGDAGGGAPEAVRAAGTHLDEHEHRVGGRDEVDFAEAAAVVAFQDPESLALEESGGEILFGAPAAGHGDERTVSLPSTNCAAVR